MRFLRMPAGNIAANAAIGVVASLAIGCNDTPETSGSARSAACGVYCDDANWVCKPDKSDDFCAQELSVTEVKPDLTTSQSVLTLATNPTVDCFYVYPTVALSQPVGNVVDYSNITDIEVPVRAQAAPFGQVCRVWAPLYHQISIATYGDPSKDQDLEVAYQDVDAAFAVFLDQIGNRDFVLMGHSQGTHMLRRLLQREIEGHPDRMARLVVALAIGPVNDITVPDGALVGGTFQQLSLCTSDQQRGCIVAYDSYPATTDPTIPTAPSGMDVPCTNPGALAGGPKLFAGSTFPTTQYSGAFGAGTNVNYDTTFAMYPNLFTGECRKRAADGTSWFAISFTPAAGDQRQNPIPFDAGLVPAIGLHVTDYSFPLVELVNLVRTKIAAPK